MTQRGTEPWNSGPLTKHSTHCANVTKFIRIFEIALAFSDDKIHDEYIYIKE